MTTHDRLEAVRRKVIAANPSIMSLPTFPYDCDARKAVIALEKIVSNIPITEEIILTASIHLKAYQEEKRAAYVRELEGRYPGRTIRLADILLAISKALNTNAYEMWLGKMFSTVEIYEVDINDNKTGGKMLWNLLKDDLNDQTQETWDFLDGIL